MPRAIDGRGELCRDGRQEAASVGHTFGRLDVVGDNRDDAQWPGLARQRGGQRDGRVVARFDNPATLQNGPPYGSEALLERTSIALGPVVVHDAGGGTVVIAHGDDDHVRAQRLAEPLSGFVVRAVGIDGTSERDAGVDDGFSSTIQ
jgi:hypothetical protein